MTAHCAVCGRDAGPRLAVVPGCELHSHPDEVAAALNEQRARAETLAAENARLERVVDAAVVWAATGQVGDLRERQALEAAVAVYLAANPQAAPVPDETGHE